MVYYASKEKAMAKVKAGTAFEIEIVLALHLEQSGFTLVPQIHFQDCWNEVIVHELLHYFGFTHNHQNLAINEYSYFNGEMTTYPRDPSQQRPNYFPAPYDYSTILYLLGKQRDWRYSSFQDNEFDPSFMHFMQINDVYNCYVNMSKIPYFCANGGYENPSVITKTKQCICPTGYAGKHCTETPKDAVVLTATSQWKEHEGSCKYDKDKQVFAGVSECLVIIKTGRPFKTGSDMALIEFELLERSPGKLKENKASYESFLAGIMLYLHEDPRMAPVMLHSAKGMESTTHFFSDKRDPLIVRAYATQRLLKSSPKKFWDKRIDYNLDHYKFRYRIVAPNDENTRNYNLRKEHQDKGWLTLQFRFCMLDSEDFEEMKDEIIQTVSDVVEILKTGKRTEKDPLIATDITEKKRSDLWKTDLRCKSGSEKVYSPRGFTISGIQFDVKKKYPDTFARVVFAMVTGRGLTSTWGPIANVQKALKVSKNLRDRIQAEFPFDHAQRVTTQPGSYNLRHDKCLRACEGEVFSDGCPQQTPDGVVMSYESTMNGETFKECFVF